MKRTIALALFFVLMLSIAACKNDVGNNGNNSSTPSEENSMDLSDMGIGDTNHNDVPTIPSLVFADIGDNEWELKRLRVSRQGFEVLNERGCVSRQDGSFVLSDTSDSTRAGYLEKDNDYLEQTFWFGLGGLIDSGAVGTILGFLEYFGFYYLVSDYGADVGIVLIPLGADTFDRGTIPFDRFCEMVWTWFEYAEAAQPTGGDGLMAPEHP